ncbi:MAG: ketosteroid isomerase [Balneola sp.]|nr:ketosteroid isomerase [Balneola sp.]|tara:strand:- start:37512 stop:37967 length:456 start_codon:yes stop_codon:yes gene_type:complete
MNENKACIQKLYTGLQDLDAETMMSCYHSEATFQDPVFQLSSKEEIGAMWGMLCSGAREFELDFEVLDADENRGRARVEASYLFSITSRKVHNEIEAKFKFKDGLILRHRDDFRFYRWSRQAFGATGMLLGWMPFFQKQVQKRAYKNLKKF